MTQQLGTKIIIAGDAVSFHNIDKDGVMTGADRTELSKATLFNVNNLTENVFKSPISENVVLYGVPETLSTAMRERANGALVPLTDVIADWSDVIADFVAQTLLTGANVFEKNTEKNDLEAKIAGRTNESIDQAVAEKVDKELPKEFKKAKGAVTGVVVAITAAIVIAAIAISIIGFIGVAIPVGAAIAAFVVTVIVGVIATTAASNKMKKSIKEAEDAVAVEKTELADTEKEMIAKNKELEEAQAIHGKNEAAKTEAEAKLANLQTFVDAKAAAEASAVQVFISSMDRSPAMEGLKDFVLKQIAEAKVETIAQEESDEEARRAEEAESDQAESKTSNPEVDIKEQEPASEALPIQTPPVTPKGEGSGDKAVPAPVPAEQQTGKAGLEHAHNKEAPELTAVESALLDETAAELLVTKAGEFTKKEKSEAVTAQAELAQKQEVLEKEKADVKKAAEAVAAAKVKVEKEKAEAEVAMQKEAEAVAAAKQAEEARVASEQAEEARVAAEQVEEARVAAEEAEEARVAAKQAEEARVAAEEAEEARVASEQAEEARVAAEEAEEVRVAAEQARVAAELKLKLDKENSEAESSQALADKLFKAAAAAQETAAKERNEANAARADLDDHTSGQESEKNETRVNHTSDPQSGKEEDGDGFETTGSGSDAEDADD